MAPDRAACLHAEFAGIRLSTTAPGKRDVGRTVRCCCLFAEHVCQAEHDGADFRGDPFRTQVGVDEAREALQVAATRPCLVVAPARRDQTFLCGMLNSFVANYLARLWVTTHLGTTTVERLPMPRPAPRSDEYLELAALAHQLGTVATPRAAASHRNGFRLNLRNRVLSKLLGRPTRDWNSAYARLQAMAAHLYGLSTDDLRLVLESFPLVDSAIPREVMVEFAKVS